MSAPTGVRIKEEVLRAAHELELRARKSLASLLSGPHKSRFRGAGMQFQEFRQYEPGDDVRHMSWTVTARTGRPTIKLFEEDREYDAILVIDVSGSTLLGLGPNRAQAYGDIAALIGLAALYSGDRLGALFFTDRPAGYLPPKRSKNQLLHMLTSLLSQPFADQKTDLRPSLKYLDRVLKSRSLVFILSDFLAPEFDDELAALSQKHEVVMLHFYSELERGSSLNGIYEVRDPEDGPSYLLDAGSRGTRDRLRQRHDELRQRLEGLRTAAGADVLHLCVEDDYVRKVANHLRGRAALLR